MAQKAVQPMTKSKAAALMGMAVNRQSLASVGTLIGKTAENTYNGTGVVSDHIFDSLTGQRS